MKLFILNLRLDTQLLKKETYASVNLLNEEALSKKEGGMVLNFTTALSFVCLIDLFGS